MLIVSTWLWGTKFNADDVQKLAASVRRNLKQPHKFICFAEKATWMQGVERCLPITRVDLTRTPGCFVRLQMFDPQWQQQLDFDGQNDRLVNVDLDTVITGPLDPLFDRPEPFVIMQGGNAGNPCPYNGALFMLRPGWLSHVWSNFSLESAARIPFHDFPDDQGWLNVQVPFAPGWKCGPSSGVYVFQKPGWPTGEHLPPAARMVTFNSWRSPSKFKHLPWVRDNWRS